MALLLDPVKEIHRNRWSPSSVVESVPRTLIGRRLVRRYRLSPSLADALAALAGFSYGEAR